MLSLPRAFLSSVFRRSVVPAFLLAVRNSALSPIPLPLRPALLGGGILFSLESSPALPLTACVALKNPPLPAPRSGAGVVHIRKSLDRYEYIDAPQFA